MSRSRKPGISESESRARAARQCARFAVVATLLLSLPAAAALYKWTDANGRVVYSDQPPPGSVKSEQLQAAPSPANPHAVRELAEQEAELKKRQQDRAKQAENEAKLRADASRRAAECSRAQAQVRALGASQDIVYRINEQGERVALDDTARVRERQELERWMRANNCQR
jgi:hypothetical protein